MIYSREVEEMCPVAQGVHHGAAPIPEEAKWVQAKEVKDISGFTHGVGWCAPQQGACKLSLNVKEGIIQEALVETIGCSGMTHSAAMAAEILPGLTVMEALNTDLVCDAINTAMRELFLQIVYGRTQSAFSEDGLPIDIPGTGVSYPVAQAEDNDYYLRRKLNGDNSFAGTVFMDYRNDPAVADDNTILYGHNMRNGSMFGLLKKYGKEEFFLAHPEIDLYLPDRILRCTVISSHQEEAQEENFPMNFESGEEKLAYIDRMKSKAWYDTGISAGEEDRLITLVTCTGNGYSHRFVVQAVVTEEIETASDGVSEALEEKP